MHRLPEDQVDAFEEHFFACAACAGVVEKTAELRRSQARRSAENTALVAALGCSAVACVGDFAASGRY
jgi:hypothetical protein